MNEISSQFNKYIDLTTKEIEKATRSALNRAANALKKATERNLAVALPASLVKNRYPDTLMGGIMRSKYDKNKSMVKVHIMGTRNSSSGTFRTRFFEGGTKERITKKGYKRGHIQALNFFSKATSTTNVDEIIEQQLEKVVNKINASKI